MVAAVTGLQLVKATEAVLVTMMATKTREQGRRGRSREMRFGSRLRISAAGNPASVGPAVARDLEQDLRWFSSTSSSCCSSLAY